MACIFLVVACHRLVVGSAHDNAHLVGGLLVLRIVGIESPTPHGRPHHVASQAEHQFEYALIESVVAIVGAVGVAYPRSETGSLVVKKNATIANGRFAIGIYALVDKNGVVALHGHICPVAPGRHTHLFRQLIDTIDGATAVAASDDELAVNEGDNEFLPFAFQLTGIDKFLLGELVDGCGVPERSYEDFGLGGGGDGSFATTHFRDVLDESLHGIVHSLAVVGILVDANLVAGVEEQVALVE